MISFGEGIIAVVFPCWDWNFFD